MRKFRQHAWYNPWAVVKLDPKCLAAWLAEAGARGMEADELAAKLQAAARRCVGLLGDRKGEKSPNLDYLFLQRELLREQRLLECYEAEERPLRKEISDLYRAVHPSRNLETIPGVGEQSAAVFAFFAHHPKRFSSQGKFRAWTGMVPRSSQSSDVEKKGLKLTQAGPSLVKKLAYLDAEAARRTDPQIAAIYYDQVVHKGKHHISAVCVCATHLLDRARAVLIRDKPYELRDVDGRVVSRQEAKQIIAERYTVPEEVRRQTTQRARKARQEKRDEEQERRRSRRRTQGADAEASG